MKERAINLYQHEVRGINAGRQTMLRRIVKLPRGWDDASVETMAVIGRRHYGQPGDRLWGRESWDFLPDGQSTAMIRYWADGSVEKRTPPAGYNPVVYGTERRRPSIHMRRWASRITLEITSVRVERLNEISETDAMAEGVEDGESLGMPGWKSYLHGNFVCTWPSASFASLWESIHGRGSWARNEWVWVVGFKRVENKS